MRVHRIVIGGINRPIKLNMAALMNIAQRTDKTLLELFDTPRFTEEEVFRTIHAALKFGAEEAGERYDQTYSALVEQLTFNEPESKLTEISEFIKTDLKEIVDALAEKEKKKAAQQPQLDVEGDLPQ